MSYNRLKFSQMFIDTSKDWNKTGKARFDINYNHVEYICKLFGFIPLKFSSEWECHYENDRNVIQIHFEQTHGWKDWIANFLFPAKMYDEFIYFDGDKQSHQIKLKACKGWMQMWFMMKHNIRDSVKKLLERYPDADVEIIGWSLGSSQASYCAQDLNFNLNVKSHLFTYGSVNPWRGHKKENKKYLNFCCKEIYNFKHKSDIVTYMPPFIGYYSANPIKLGKFSFIGLFNPWKYHTSYDQDSLYENIK